MQTRSMRARVRMLLGRWGGWMVMLSRLRRERAAARAWVEQEGGDAPRALLEKIEAEIADLLRLRNAMSALVYQLPVDEQRVLLLRYEQDLSWLQIAIRLNYDERSVRRLETQAVDEIGKGLAPANPAE